MGYVINVSTKIHHSIIYYVIHADSYSCNIYIQLHYQTYIDKDVDQTKVLK